MLILCKCGCGTLIESYREYPSDKRFFVPGHQIRGIRNRLWKGDSVSYGALHQYLRRHMPRPDKCEICNRADSYDLANKTGIYDRDFKNWYWLCRRCHQVSDGRLDRLVEMRLARL